MAKNIKLLPQDIERDLTRAKHLFEEELPNFMVEQLEKLAKEESFDNEKHAFEKASGKWKPRKGGTKSSKRERAQLLVRSGRLRNSIRAFRRGSFVVLEAGYEVGTKTKWNLAQIHNEGLRPQPQRQFMPKQGESAPVLEKRTEGFLNKKIKGFQ